MAWGQEQFQLLLQESQTSEACSVGAEDVCLEELRYQWMLHKSKLKDVTDARPRARSKVREQSYMPINKKLLFFCLAQCPCLEVFHDCSYGASGSSALFIMPYLIPDMAQLMLLFECFIHSVTVPLLHPSLLLLLLCCHCEELSCLVISHHRVAL